ncbi:MAG TPA: zinc-dependent metalloprotease [Solirubrobacteraceae bacterium]|nr:zinc-dependent metalloprotease [Solirubrobacteraceae bacterium]
MPAPVIDWIVAEWVAGLIAGRGDSAMAGVSGIDLRPLAADAERRVVQYTGLVPAGPIPVPEGVSRREWTASNIASTRAMIEPMLERTAAKLGPGKAAGRLWLGVMSSAEIGLLIGYMGQRVLGQYELLLMGERDAGEERDAANGHDPPPEPRLLFVLPNLDEAVQKFEADDLEFVTWVTLHEVTHAVQFGGVPWLQDYLASLVRQLMDSAERRMELRRQLHLPRREDLKRVGRAALHGDLMGMLATDSERATIDKAQAVMAVIEGHAEHVMDAVAPELLPTLPDLRQALDRRRRSQSGLSKYISRLLGMEMKLRQYQQGKAFCDAIVADAGTAALRHVFSAPEALPTLDEVEHPQAWLSRCRDEL